MAAPVAFPPHARSGLYGAQRERSTSSGRAGAEAASWASYGSPSPGRMGSVDCRAQCPVAQEVANYLSSASPPRDDRQAAEYVGIAEAVAGAHQSTAAASPPAVAAHLLRLLTRQELDACHVAKARLLHLVGRSGPAAGGGAEDGPPGAGEEEGSAAAPSDSDTLPSFYQWQPTPPGACGS
eukprot:TRINITY_DN50341_c0_g1_i1.p2 TRINITY_DN50341_c0_g1~~TRINITY_DN50341_c0_g1_i1.p2  ORF type:complete len:206 (+),score=66.66 TRINITY_DN50341_c0_g1_i1:78-620(+)